MILKAKNRLFKSFLSLAAISILFSYSSFTVSAPTYCSDHAPGAHPNGLQVSDVTFDGSNSDDCHGVYTSNDTVSDVNSAWPTGWAELVKDDGPGTATTGNYMGVDFTLEAEAGTSGNWTLEWVTNGLPGLPLNDVDIVAAIKAGDGFALYLFNDLDFITDPGSGSGTWEVAYNNSDLGKNNSNTPDLSHLTLYVRGGTTPDPDPDPEPDPSAVPVPPTVWLFGTGIVGMLGFSRKKTQA